VVVAVSGTQFAGYVDPKPYFPQKGSDKGPSIGSQGKLFRDAKPTAKHRYQRGYTPERMAQVKAMPIKTYTGDRGGAFSGAAGHQQVREVIARSATPAEEIKPQFTGDTLTIRTGASLGSNAGTYAKSKFGGHGTIDLDRGYGSKSHPHENREQAGQTLLHELGHARSNYEYTEHSALDTRAKLGEEEAYADDNMMKRWRPDPRDVRRGRSHAPSPSYESPDAFKGYQVPAQLSRITGGKTAHKAYLAARQTPIQRDIRLKQAAGERRAAYFQPQMIRDTGGHSQNPTATGHEINPFYKVEAPLHPMQFGKLG
jgi:hypothetical protein